MHQAANPHQLVAQNSVCERQGDDRCCDHCSLNPHDVTNAGAVRDRAEQYHRKECQRGAEGDHARLLPQNHRLAPDVVPDEHS